MESNTSETVQRQIIVHKSNWGSQAIKVLIFVIIAFALYKKNPSTYELQKYLVKNYCEEQGVQQPLCKIISENSPDFLSGFVERKDFVFFSYYSLKYKGDKTNINLEFLGVLGAFIDVSDGGNK